VDYPNMHNEEQSSQEARQLYRKRTCRIMVPASLLPLRAAQCKALQPSMSTSWGLQPRTSRRRTQSWKPL
jgi:hypothetical protein